MGTSFCLFISKVKSWILVNSRISPMWCDPVVKFWLNPSLRFHWGCQTLRFPLVFREGFSLRIGLWECLSTIVHNVLYGHKYLLSSDNRKEKVNIVEWRQSQYIYVFTLCEAIWMKRLGWKVCGCKCIGKTLWVKIPDTPSKPLYRGPSENTLARAETPDAESALPINLPPFFPRWPIGRSSWDVLIF